MRCQITFFFSKLGKRCQVGLLGLGFAVGLVGLGFSWDYISYNTFTCIPVVVVSRGLGMGGWNSKGLDDIPN